MYKNKGDVQSGSSYRWIKLMIHTVKMLERVVEVRLKDEVMICEPEDGFIPRKSYRHHVYCENADGDV